MNVLITSASRKVSIVKAFKEALRQAGGGKVFAIDMSPFSSALFHSDVSYLAPPDASASFVSDMVDFCRKNKIDLIVPTRDEELIIFATHKEKFKQAGTEVMVSGVKAIEVCLDKIKFVDFCKSNGMAVPKDYSIDEAMSGAAEFPLFVRNRFGKSAKLTSKVGSKDELNLVLKYIKEPVIQEYITDKEYTVDLFVDFKGNIISVVPRERIYCFGGESFIGRTCKEHTLIESAIKLADKLGLIGHNTIQCFFGKEGVKFIEVNPRYGGGVNLSFAAGANTPLYLIQLLQGKKVNKQVGNFREGLIMLRYTEDIFVDEDKINTIESFHG